MFRRVFFGATIPLAAWTLLSAAGCGSAAGILRIGAPTPEPRAEFRRLGVYGGRRCDDIGGVVIKEGLVWRREPGGVAAHHRRARSISCSTSSNSAGMGDKRAGLSGAGDPRSPFASHHPQHLRRRRRRGGRGRCERPLHRRYHRPSSRPCATSAHRDRRLFGLAGVLGDVCTTSSTQTLAGAAGRSAGTTTTRRIRSSRAGDPMNPQDYSESALADLGAANFLDWFPQTTEELRLPAPGAPAIADPTKLASDLQDMVIQGRTHSGCGDRSRSSRAGTASSCSRTRTPSLTEGLDRQACSVVGRRCERSPHRPARGFPSPRFAGRRSSVLSDENDSEVDVRSFWGNGLELHVHRLQSARGARPICMTNPGDPSCTSMRLPGRTQTIRSARSKTASIYGPRKTARTGDTTSIFGTFTRCRSTASPVQFPIERYVLGLHVPEGARSRQRNTPRARRPTRG